MVDYVPTEKGTPIRQPSTANLMIDSTDATGGNASSFAITRNASIMNGFFTRLGVTEVVLDWNIPNIATALGNVTFTISAPVALSVTIPAGLYTIAQCLEAIAFNLTTAIQALGAPYANSYFAITQSTLVTPGITLVDSSLTRLVFWTGGSGSQVLTAFTTVQTTLLSQLGGIAGVANATIGQPFANTANLQSTRYLDFISPDLTYCQSLKDNSTQVTGAGRNVLCRWYMAYDNPAPLDKYGFPIQMGYAPFSVRRIFSPPKQIKWEPNLPVGNINLQVYNSDGTLQFSGNGAQGSAGFQWLMTIQFSEV
jgi:hypothetical protein